MREIFLFVSDLADSVTGGASPEISSEGRNMGKHSVTLRDRRLFLTIVVIASTLFTTRALAVSSKESSKESTLLTFNMINGATPNDLISDSAGNLYGTTTNGGGGACINGGFTGCGTVFKLTKNSKGVWNQTVLYEFLGGSDGQWPRAGLRLDSAGNLYGTTSWGGVVQSGLGLCAVGCGTVFELTANGAGWTETVLYRFCSDAGCSDGAHPLSRLFLDSVGKLFGTTFNGGSGQCINNGGCGTVFELMPFGSNWTETTLYRFCTDTNCGSGLGPDGVGPAAGLISDTSGNLYGTTEGGGSDSAGTVFKLSQSDNVWNESILFSFDGSNGASPLAALLFDDAGNLYSSAALGGNAACPNGCGLIFQLTPTAGGWTQTVLHEFNGQDGANPSAALVFDKTGNLYGTTQQGGATDTNTNCGIGCGTVFKLTHLNSVAEEKVLFRFNLGNGESPAGLVLGNKRKLFGTAMSGGSNVLGVVFELD